MVLTLPPKLRVTPEQFWQICRANPEAVLELNAAGEIELMTPTGWQSGRRNSKMSAALENWVQQTGLGTAFDSSTGFRLANGAVRSPDAAWVSPEQMAKVSADEPDHFFPGCPEFVIELASASDDPAKLRLKMAEYRDNGALLGWLILPLSCQVEVYSANQPVQTLKDPAVVSADPLLPGFELALAALW